MEPAYSQPAVHKETEKRVVVSAHADEIHELPPLCDWDGAEVGKALFQDLDV